MKILHFLSHFSMLSETFIYDEINSLEQARPNSNTILTCERHLEKERPFQNVVALRPNLSFNQDLHRRYLRRFKGIQIPREHFPLCSYLDKNLDSFDLVQAHFGWNAVTLWQALKLLGRETQKPLLVRCHGSDINLVPTLDPEYQRLLLELAASSNVLLTAHSENLKHKMIRLGIAPGKIHFVANTFNKWFLTHRKQVFYQRGADLRLISTGRFIEWKGQRYLVKAFARFVREVWENSVLTLIGDGETLPQVKRLAEQEGVFNKIRFLGPVPHQELARHLGENDLYIQPSIRDPRTFQEEGLPISVLEALAVGLPVVVTRTGGMPEIVGEDNPFARIVPGQDSEALFRALKEMFEAGICFQDTSDYSQKRLAAFTNEQQMQDLKSAYSKILNVGQLAAAI